MRRGGRPSAKTTGARPEPAHQQASGFSLDIRFRYVPVFAQNSADLPAAVRKLRRKPTRLRPFGSKNRRSDRGLTRDMADRATSARRSGGARSGLRRSDRARITRAGGSRLDAERSEEHTSEL